MISPNTEYAIKNRKEIVSILENLVKYKIPINLDTEEGVTLVTLVLNVSSEGNYVYLDVSQDDALNERVMKSGEVKFSTQSGIKIRWHATRLLRTSMPDGDVFAMEVPSIVERIQRREYFRLLVPQGRNAMICKIPAATGLVEATILDLSAEGVCIRIKGGLPEEFTQGLELAGCSIDLPDAGLVTMGLRICRIWETESNHGEDIVRIGLKFINLSRSAGNLINRQIIELEAIARHGLHSSKTM